MLFAQCLIARVVLLLSISLFAVQADDVQDRFNLVSKDSHVLNVHVVPHTHDDVGWLKTVEQYYYGLNNTIQHANVNAIISSVIRALQEDKDRTFTYVEMAFFSMWYNDQPNRVRKQVKKLVKSGQLTFVNGGWCMHDEATTHYMGMIDQTTLGHDFLKQNFDYTPSVGWQLDPFGHSASQASLMTSEMGFNALYFGRIDYQDLQIRQNEQRCEGIWSSSPSLDTDVFWSLSGSYEGNYGAPSSFCFDMLCADPPIVDDKDSSEYNLDERVSKFLKDIAVQGSRTKGNNIMLTFGSDFQFENAFENFQNMDSLINGVKAIQDLEKYQLPFEDFRKINIFYSSPEIYTKAKYDEHLDLEVKRDDFFPYSDCAHCFWTGYFTSRASLKRLERYGSSFLHAARQIDALNVQPRELVDNTYKSELYDLESSVSILQHHDGVSGTSKQHVAYDYAKRVWSSILKASDYTEKVLSKALGSDLDFKFCHALNVSVCDISQDASKDTGYDIYVAPYNALPSSRSEVLSIPVTKDATYRVLNTATGEVVESELIPWKNYAENDFSSNFKLYFNAENLPPLGSHIYKIEMINMIPSSIQSKSLNEVRSLRSSKKESKFTVDNGMIAARFDSFSGKLEHLMRKDRSSSVDVSLQWGYYNSFTQNEHTVQESISNQPQGGDSMGSGQCMAGYVDWEGDERKWLKDSSATSQNSGAYIFRPSKPDESLSNIESTATVTRIIESNLVTEVHTNVSPWLQQIVRIVKNKSHIEVEYTVKNVPVKESGKEIVLRYKTNVNNSDTFFTDSNGRDFMKRVRSERETWDLKEFEPVAGNYYPVNTAIFIEDEKASLAVVTDRSQGGSSLSNGFLELMVQRRTTKDDFRGVDEPLDETDEGINPYPPYGDRKRRGKGVTMTGLHRVVIGSNENGASAARSVMDSSFSPVHLFFAKAKLDRNNINPMKNKSISLSANTSLPQNVMVITYKRLMGVHESYLLRIGHQYAIEEDKMLSRPVVVDIATLFQDKYIKNIDEKTLSGNQDMKHWRDKRMRWKRDDESNEFDRIDIGTQFVIRPLQIRTFIVTLESSTDVDLNLESDKKIAI